MSQEHVEVVRQANAGFTQAIRRVRSPRSTRGRVA